MMRLTALLLLAASVAGFSSLPKFDDLPAFDEIDEIEVGGGRTSNTNEVCRCDITITGGNYGFTCKDLDLPPVRAKWCLECYLSREDSPPCATALAAGILSGCASYRAATPSVAAEWEFVIQQVTDNAPIDQTCPAIDPVAGDSCPELTAGKTQISPIDDNGYSTKYCSSVRPAAGQTCEDYFGYYNFASDPTSTSYIYPCVTRANGCVGTGAFGKLFCGGPP